MTTNHQAHGTVSLARLHQIREILSKSQLLWASSCYVLNAIHPFNRIPFDWPWTPEWWKPTNPRRDMVKAGALILAEIERIDRQEVAQ